MERYRAVQNSAYLSFSVPAMYSRRILLDFFFYNFFFYLAVVDRRGLGEGKDAQRLLHKAVVLLPSSEVPPPGDTHTPTQSLLGRVGLGRLPRNEVAGINEAPLHAFSLGLGGRKGVLCVCFPQVTRKAPCPSEMEQAVLQLSHPSWYIAKVLVSPREAYSSASLQPPQKQFIGWFREAVAQPANA